MKKFLAILILIFTLQTPSWADDIRDFEIGNFTLNESLLDNYKKDYLMSNWKSQKRGYNFNSKKYYKIVFSDTKVKPYDSIILYTLRSDKLFKIKSITGFRKKMDIKKCYREQISIADEISKLFPNASKKTYGPIKKKVDPTGKSTEKGIYFVLNNGGAAGVACIDYGKEYTKKKSYVDDHMQIYLDTEEYSRWLINEAWK